MDRLYGHTTKWTTMPPQKWSVKVKTAEERPLEWRMSNFTTSLSDFLSFMNLDLQNIHQIATKKQ